MQLKQQLSKFLLVISLGLLLGGGLLNLKANDSSVDEEHQTKDLEDLLDKYQKDSKAVLDAYSHFDENGNTLSEEDMKSLEDSGLNDSQKKSVINSDKNASRKGYLQALRKKNKGQEELTVKEQVALALAPLQSLDDKRLTEVINRAIDGSHLKIVAQKFPNFSELLKNIIKSEEAIPGIVNIAEDKQRLIYFAAAILTSFIIGFLSKRIFYGRHYGCVGTVVGFILHCIFMTAIRIGIVIYFFGQDLSPTFKIITSWIETQF